ncbi:MAG: GNAT family N-acetyltransferase [Armatimonadota bacterium]
MSDRIDAAIETFAGGWCYTRSFTHPYVATRLTPQVLRLHDGPRSNPNADVRREEFVCFGCSPSEALAISASAATGNYAICFVLPLGADDTEVRREFKALGCRLGATEAFMDNDVPYISATEPIIPIVRISDQAHADAIGKAWRRKQILSRDIGNENAVHRVYTIHDGEKYIGSCGSIRIEDASWISSLYVDAEYRRKGLGTALMTRVMADDRALGIRKSVLLASHTGAMLYPTVGFSQLGTLYVYNPPRELRAK